MPESPVYEGLAPVTDILPAGMGYSTAVDISDMADGLNDLACGPVLAIYVSVRSTITVTLAKDTLPVTFTDLPAGLWPLAIKRLHPEIEPVSQIVIPYKAGTIIGLR